MPTSSTRPGRRRTGSTPGPLPAHLQERLIEAMRSKFSRERRPLRLRRGSLQANEKRVEHADTVDDPGLELVFEIYYGLLPDRWAFADPEKPHRGLPKPGATKGRRRLPPPPPSADQDKPSPWQRYLDAHEDQRREGHDWKALVRGHLLPRCPGLAKLVERRPRIVESIAEILRQHAATRGDGRRPAYQSPESLAVALTARALKKDPRSVERRVSFEQAPWSIAIGSRLPRQKCAPAKP